MVMTKLARKKKLRYFENYNQNKKKEKEKKQNGGNGITEITTTRAFKF